MKTYREAMREAACAYLGELLKLHGDNMARAARVAGLNRTHLYNLLRKYEMGTLRKNNSGNAAWQALGAQSCHPDH